MVRIHADPRVPRRRVGRGEAGVPGSVPLHRRARIVPSDEREGRHHRFRRLAPGLLHALAVGVDGLQIAVLVELGEMGVGHAQLLALINVGGATVHVQQHAERLGAQLARLAVRNNLYIWATMNTSDQSLFPIDSAFKRRWDWKYMPIDTKKENWNIEVDGKKYSWSDFGDLSMSRYLK